MYARILIDNLTRDSLIPEWGLSVYLEYEGRKILLDTGATGRFVKNADACGIALEEVEFGVLSHAHYDHADGMAAFFRKNKKASFYLREGIRENCYGKGRIFHRYIGIHRGFLRKYQDRIVFVSGNYEILPGVTLLPHTTKGLEALAESAHLYIKKGRAFYPDPFEHEQSLVFDTEKGLVIFNSCSHGGADTIIREAAGAFPGKRIYAIIGGFHLVHTPEEKVRELADGIRKTGIERVYTGHCTGQKAFQILKEELGKKAEQIYTGMEIVL